VSQIANRMKHEHIQFAGIIGSDVLDVLFITRFMRTASPDTRLFLIQPDLLFVHAADALPFDGVLAVTTYPLLNGIRRSKIIKMQTRNTGSFRHLPAGYSQCHARPDG